MSINYSEVIRAERGRRHRPSQARPGNVTALRRPACRGDVTARSAAARAAAPYGAAAGTRAPARPPPCLRTGPSSSAALSVSGRAGTGRGARRARRGWGRAVPRGGRCPPAGLCPRAPSPRGARTLFANRPGAPARVAVAVPRCRGLAGSALAWKAAFC